MSLKETLDGIGKVVAGIIMIVIMIQFLFVWTKYCQNFQDKDYDVSVCIEKLVFLIIPTEVSIAQFLESSPYLLVIVLILYWIFVSPHLEKG
ncbi:MAG: hypothetical protein WC438_00045 [Candidatus Pacearchaeota archaeon]